MSKEAMKLALEALKQIDEAMPFPVAKLAQAALREALAEQPSQQEPVAWMVEFENGEQELHFEEQSIGETQTPLYPPAQPIIKSYLEKDNSEQRCKYGYELTSCTRSPMDCQCVLDVVFEQQAQQEPVAFEEWLAKQHGDPEEIGFLQALRIAYIAGQDSITSPPAQRTWVGLTDEKMADYLGDRYHSMTENELEFFRLGEAIYGIKENT